MNMKALAAGLTDSGREPVETVDNVLCGTPRLLDDAIVETYAIDKIKWLPLGEWAETNPPVLRNGKRSQQEGDEDRSCDFVHILFDVFTVRALFLC